MIDPPSPINQLSALYRRADGNMRTCNRYPQESCNQLRCSQRGCHAANEILNAAVARAPEEPAAAAAPIDMVLSCPNCGQQHLDEPDERSPDWTNPPHRSHLCHGCGWIWRPADVATNGVRAINSRGQNDSQPTADGPPPAGSLDASRITREQAAQVAVSWKDEVQRIPCAVSPDYSEGWRDVCDLIANKLRDPDFHI